MNIKWLFKKKSKEDKYQMICPHCGCVNKSITFNEEDLDAEYLVDMLEDNIYCSCCGTKNILGISDYIAIGVTVALNLALIFLVIKILFL